MIMHHNGKAGQNATMFKTHKCHRWDWQNSEVLLCKNQPIVPLCEVWKLAPDRLRKLWPKWKFETMRLKDSAGVFSSSCFKCGKRIISMLTFINCFDVADMSVAGAQLWQCVTGTHQVFAFGVLDAPFHNQVQLLSVVMVQQKTTNVIRWVSMKWCSSCCLTPNQWVAVAKMPQQNQMAHRPHHATSWWFQSLLGTTTNSAIHTACMSFDCVNHIDEHF